MRRFLFLSLVGLILVLTPPRAGHAQAVHDLADVLVDLTAPVTEQAGKRTVYRFASTAVAATYNGVVVQGFAAGDSLRAWVRFDAEAGWRPLYVVRSATDAAFMAAYRGTSFRSDQAFELRFELTDGQALRVLAAGVFDNRRDTDRQAPPAGQTPLQEALQKTSDFLIVPPVLITRSDWGAESFRGTPVPLNNPAYRYITFHHAAGFGATTLAEGRQQVRAIQDFHQNGRGWSDIGYQFVMDQSGRLYQGRPFLNGSVPFAEGPPLVQGAHVGGFNTGNIGVCVLGCYHPPEPGFPCEDRMTDAAVDSLVTMFAYLAERYGVPPDNIRGHRDFGATACPGDNNYALLPTIRERVGTLLRTGNRPLGTAALNAEVDETGVVRLSWSFLSDGGIATYQVERVYDEEATVIYEAEGALDETITDSRLARPGPVTYRLRARSALDRVQVLAVTEVVVETPEAYVLAPGFPNPSQGDMTIRYFVDQEGIVTLTVHDVLGRTVATPVNTFQDGGRWYAVAFDGSGLSSGTYYYRLQVEGFAGVVFEKTRSMVVAK